MAHRRAARGPLRIARLQPDLAISQSRSQALALPREMRVYTRDMKTTLLLRRGSDRGAKDDRALRLDPRARGRHARAIQSLAKNRARRNGFPDRARAARRTGPIDGRAKREGAGKASARVASAPAEDQREAAVRLTPAGERGAAARGAPCGTKRSGGSRPRWAPTGADAAADARAQSLIFLASLRVSYPSNGG